MRSAFLVIVACAVAASGCRDRASSQGVPSGPAAQASSPEAERQAMVRDQLQARGIRDARVLEAMRTVPRDRFVAEPFRRLAYEDTPLPIGRGQTI